MTPPPGGDPVAARPGGAPTAARPAGRRATRPGALLLVAALAVTGAVVLLRTTVAEPVRVTSSSMSPGYRAGDVVLAGKVPPAVEDLDHGDLVLLESPDDGRRTLKRVVGLPGESVVIRDAHLYVDGRRATEPWVDHELVDGYWSATTVVPPGTVFVLGDNRGNSVDSRDYGPVPERALLGRVLARLWPLRR